MQRFIYVTTIEYHSSLSTIHHVPEHGWISPPYPHTCIIKKKGPPGLPLLRPDSPIHSIDGVPQARAAANLTPQRTAGNRLPVFAELNEQGANSGHP